MDIRNMEIGEKGEIPAMRTGWERSEQFTAAGFEDMQESGGTREGDGAGEAIHTKESGGTQNVILQIEKEDGNLEAIDLINVAGYMKQKRRFFAYLLVIAVCIGFGGAALSLGVQRLFTGGSASAVITFNFDGLDEGLGPDGAVFDVSKIKSTAVINDALEDLGWEKEEQDVEEIRTNLKIEGVIPDSVKKEIAVINTVAEDAAEYYANINDLNYFPSQYTVSLKRCAGMSGSKTQELLDAILLSYKDYFMDTYANISVIGLATSVLEVESYDYLQASDMLENEIDTIKGYVDAKANEAPDFRASSTGLSFSDLSSSIAAVKRIDLGSFISFVQTNNLTKDAGVQVDYYNYQIEQYNYEIQELQTQLSNVEKTIEAYEKDPVIVMSSQESVAETSQTNEYYDTMLSQKLDLSRRISELNTDLNEAYEMVTSLNSMMDADATSEDFAYADSLLESLMATVDGWTELVQRTTEEYFDTELFADAYRISIPAQYSALGDIGDLIKRMILFGGIAAGIVIILWGAAGLKEEIGRSRG